MESYDCSILIPFTGMGMGKQESLGDIAGMDDLKFDFNYDDIDS